MPSEKASQGLETDTGVPALEAGEKSPEKNCQLTSLGLRARTMVYGGTLLIKSKSMKCSPGYVKDSRLR